MEELLEKVSNNWPDVFLPENLAALAAMSEADFARFCAEIRQRKAKIGVNELKRAVKEYRQQQKAAAAGLEVLPGGGDAERRTRIRDIWPDSGESSDVELPPGYAVRGRRISRTIQRGEDIVQVPVTTGPLYVARELENIDAGPNDLNRYRREVRFLSNGAWKSIYPWIATIETPKKFSELLSSGLPTDHTLQRETMLYLTEFVKYNKMTDKMPVIRTTSMAGRISIDDTPYIVYPAGVWGVNGPAENPPIIFSADAVPDSVKDVSLLPGGSQEEARQVVELLRRCAEPATAWCMLGWFAAALLAPVIRLAWNEFPILNIYGGRGSGKSSLLQAMSMAFFAVGSLGSARRPPFSLLREISATSMIPVILDEYRVYEIRDDHRDILHHLLRHAYRAGRETRGRPDQTTIDYHLLAPVVLSGESMVEDAAIRERSVILPVSRATVCDFPGAREAYQELTALGPDTLRRTAGWLWSRSLGMAGAEDAEVMDGLREVAEKLQERFFEMTDRVIHSMAAVVFGSVWLAENIGWDVEEIPADDIYRKFVNAQAQEETPLAGFIRFLELENSRKPKDRKVPMRADLEHGHLIVCQVAAVEGYGIYARQARLPFLGRDALVSELRESAIFIADSTLKSVGGKKSRCLVLDIDIIQKKYGIPADSWPESWPPSDDDVPLPSDDDIPF